MPSGLVSVDKPNQLKYFLKKNKQYKILNIFEYKIFHAKH